MYTKEDLLKWYDKDYCLEAVKQDGLVLKFVKNQTKEICLTAVKQDGLILQCVKNQTEEICLEAVKQNNLAFRYVNLELVTLKMIHLVLNKDLDNIQYIDIIKFPHILQYYEMKYL